MKDKRYRTSYRTGKRGHHLGRRESFPPIGSEASLRDRVLESISLTHSYYTEQQHSDGYWWYELESNVTITAEYFMILHYLGLHDPERDSRIIRHILKNQRDDGTWAIHAGGVGDLSTTVEAYFALKLAGYPKDSPSLVKARDFILRQGGIEAARVFTKIYLAVFGQFDWRSIPSIPVELNLMPHWFPINIYNFSSWARSTIVPLSIIISLKPTRKVPDSLGVRELYVNPDMRPPLTQHAIPPFSWKRFFIFFDRVFKLIESSSLHPLRKIAFRRTERWILDHQEPTGDWGGIQPAMVNSILALHVLGYDVNHDIIRRGLAAIESFTIEKDDEIVLQSCISPVWDTALTALGLIYSGMDTEHRSLTDAAQWLSDMQIFTKGDWSVKRPDLPPGGWAFEFVNNWYPDVDDTSVVLIFLKRFLDSDFIVRENIDRGIAWVLGMQGKDGGWGAFDVDNDFRFLNQLPFGDLEAMIDPSTPDITGRVLELLGTYDFQISDQRVLKAIAFLKKTQEEDGSWWGRWGVNYLYGTSAVLTGLAAIGENMNAAYVQKAAHWLKNHQNRDGGWGECCESYADNRLKCCGVSTPSQTAWAILALIAAGHGASGNVIKAVRFLLREQKNDGTWEEEYFTGTGFPKYFMIRYHNYRNCFPLMALGRFHALVRGNGKH